MRRGAVSSGSAQRGNSDGSGTGNGPARGGGASDANGQGDGGGGPSVPVVKSGEIDMLGRVDSIDTTARTLQFAPDDSDTYGDMVTILVPASIDMSQFSVDDAPELIVVPAATPATYTLRRVFVSDPGPADPADSGSSDPANGAAPGTPDDPNDAQGAGDPGNADPAP
jgi:hypothetical protein